VVALVVVDVSAPTKEEGLGINLFAPEERLLPAPQPGDIIRLHRLQALAYPSLLHSPPATHKAVATHRSGGGRRHQIQRYGEGLQGVGSHNKYSLRQGLGPSCT
jgi:hypothetical protein